MSGTALTNQRRTPSASSAGQGGIAQTEQRELVAVRPDEQVDTGRRTIGHGGQRMPGQPGPVHDGKVGQGKHPRVRTAPAELFGGRDQLGRRHPLEQRSAGAGDAQHGSESLRRSLRLLHRVDPRPPALHDGPAKQTGGGGNPEQGGDAEPTGGFAEDRHVVGIAPEGGDVVVHPTEGSDLVVKPPVAQQAVGVGQVAVAQEPESAQPVVDGHDDGVTVAHEAAASVEEDRAAARGEAAAVDPHHDRPPCPAADVGVSGRCRRPDVQ